MDDLLKLANSISKYCVGMEGNVSMIHNNSILIKASGCFLSLMTKDDIIELDSNHKQVTNLNKLPSMELSFHIWLLNKLNMKFVAHTHPTKTVSILCSNFIHEFANNRLFPDQVIFNGYKSCVIPYAKPGEDLTEAIKLGVNSFIEKEHIFPKLILLQNHGIIACGKSYNECIIISDICEKSAEIFLESRKLNTIYLSDFDIQNLIFDKKELYRVSLL